MKKDYWNERLNERYLNNINLTTKERIYAEETANSYMEIPFSKLSENYQDTIFNSKLFDFYDRKEGATEEQKDRFYEALKYLTTKQRKILDLTLEGLTQTEIADKLGLDQSSITKALYGNDVYEAGIKVRYGGMVNKLKYILLDRYCIYCKEKIDYSKRKKSIYCSKYCNVMRNRNATK